MIKTKKIRITLAVLTRVEYSEVLEVPADITDGELDKLVDHRYDTIDGGLFQNDPDYWERGACFHEKANVSETSNAKVAIENGDFIVSPYGTTTQNIKTGEDTHAQSWNQNMSNYLEVQTAVDNAKSRRELCQIAELTDTLFLSGELHMTGQDWVDFTDRLQGKIQALEDQVLTEDELADFMLQRIENGDISAEDIPVRLARYGLMEPTAFVAEMRERMCLESSKDRASLLSDWYVLYGDNCLQFHCKAEDREHAIEQCQNAYPDETIHAAVPATQHGEFVIELLTDDPVTCPKCGARTDFKELPLGKQEHTCLSCKHSFIAEPDNE